MKKHNQERQPVTVSQSTVNYPTYGVGAADKNPMFFEKRVYQASSGKVYPLPFTDKVSVKKQDKDYIGLHIENEYLQVLVLPELGGRIQRALDKTNDYDFIYHNQVIKPALVGLAGPWISGGIEFNWPQHHRPTTFMAVDYSLQEHDDGAKTIWVGEIEPMGRTKVLTGITLRPGYAYIEISSKYFNCTPFMNNFLWWANPAVAVNDDYQSFFPQDVDWVADHGKRDISTFPDAQGTYYDINYGERSDDEKDISRFRNIPVPTSYMALGSKFDFFGGYDHGRKAGLLHFADHHISPGKKQWTWGNEKFGQAWDRNLTDQDGPYIELMAGCFTDNQPDFTWIAPFETKTFKQYFFPFKEIGLPKNANPQAALNIEMVDGIAHIAIYATHIAPQAQIILDYQGETLFCQQHDLSPSQVFNAEIVLPEHCVAHQLTLSLNNNSGKKLLSYSPIEKKQRSELNPATAAKKPTEISSNEELFLNGLHLEQYRHATRAPEPYYQEALARDPGDSRCNTAMGSLLMRKGRLTQALPYFDRAINRITLRNPNPYDGEAYYQKGICLKLLEQDQTAYDCLHKSAWNAAWAGPAYFALAELACKKGDFDDALEKLEQALNVNVFNTRASNLKATVLRKLQRFDEARSLAEATRASDPLDHLAYFELSLLDGNNINNEGCCENNTDTKFIAISRSYHQTLIDLANHYANAGFYQEAIKLCSYSEQAYPMISYFVGLYQYKLGQTPSAFKQAALQSADYCFPSRLDEMLALIKATELNPDDGMAHYYLGNLYYDKNQHQLAITHWEKTNELAPTFATAYRNLGLAYFNKNQDGDRALSAYQKAFTLNPSDGRVLFELDQLRKKLKHPINDRLQFIETYHALIQQRDDLTVEWLALNNQLGDHQQVLAVLNQRWFTPWEGGEGKVVAQYEHAHIALGLQALAAGNTLSALDHFQSCKVYPDNLGEGKMITTAENNIDYFIALTHQALGNNALAESSFKLAAQGDLTGSDLGYFKALAKQQLGHESDTLFEQLHQQAKQLKAQPAEIDYFAISLPDFLVFDNDLTQQQTIEALYLSALAEAGLNKPQAAVVLLQEILSLDPAQQKAQLYIDIIASQVL